MEIISNLNKDLTGTILTIGFGEESDFVKELKKNKQVDEVYTLVSNNGLKKQKKKKKKLNGTKNIDIKKLKKVFKKTKFDYIICDFNTILPFFRSFVKNSILLTNKEVIFFINNEDYDEKEIIYRYDRYNAKVIRNKIKNEVLLHFDVSDIKIPYIKTYLYWFRDIGYDFIEFIANILIG